MSEKPTLALTAEQLQDMFRAVIQEARRPPEPTEEEKARVESAKKDRQQQGELELKKIRDRKVTQKYCQHTQPNGTAAIAQLYDLGALICVHCQAMIKPSPGPHDEGERYIYDADLYYLLLSKVPQTTF